MQARLHGVQSEAGVKPTPWTTRPPRAGRGWLVIAADGREVCEIDGECEGDGSEEAHAIVGAVNVRSERKEVAA